MPTTVAKIGDDTDIIDVTAFRDGLEKIRDAGTMDEDSLRIVREFLDAWDRKHRGEDD